MQSITNKIWKNNIRLFDINYWIIDKILMDIQAKVDDRLPYIPLTFKLYLRDCRILRLYEL